jgi:hypothetical protein
LHLSYFTLVFTSDNDDFITLTNFSHCCLP